VPGSAGVVIPMVIQTTQLVPPEPNWTDNMPHLTSLDPTGADQSDAEHSPTDLAVGGSSPSRCAKSLRSARISLLTQAVLIIVGAIWSTLVDDQEEQARAPNGQ
jgi:hypothetical protein